MSNAANVLLLVSDPLDAAISIRRDLLALQDGMRQLEAAATFYVRAAETEKVQDHLSRGNSPRYAVLHYLGHGYKAPDSADGVLIFEKDDGTADALDQIRLGVALKGAAAEFKLAVISACHSESVANAVFTVGVEHVVAIDGDKTVYEAAAVAFGRRFYQCLTALLQNLYVVTGELRKQRNRFDRALACALRCGDREGEANVLKAMGDLLMRVADWGGARASYEKALPIYREIEARLGEANVLTGIGQLALAEDNQIEADRLLEQAIAIYQTFEDRYSIAAQTGNYGWTLRRLGQPEKARPYFLRAAELFAEMGWEDYAERHRAAAE